jgi:hypothetical protein
VEGGGGRRRWKEEVEGGGGRRRWKEEVEGGGGRKRWKEEVAAAIKRPPWIHSHTSCTPPSCMNGLVDLVCRPPRAEYDATHLGPQHFALNRATFERKDVVVVNSRGHRLQCSHFVPRSESPLSPMPCVIYCHGNCGSRCKRICYTPNPLRFCACVLFETCHWPAARVTLRCRRRAGCGRVAAA